MSENDLCEECHVMEYVTVVDDIKVCYRCAKRIRQKTRVSKDKYKREEEEINEF